MSAPVDHRRSRSPPNGPDRLGNCPFYRGSGFGQVGSPVGMDDGWREWQTGRHGLTVSPSFRNAESRVWSGLVRHRSDQDWSS